MLGVAAELAVLQGPAGVFVDDGKGPVGEEYGGVLSGCGSKWGHG